MRTFDVTVVIRDWKNSTARLELAGYPGLGDNPFGEGPGLRASIFQLTRDLDLAAKQLGIPSAPLERLADAITNGETDLSQFIEGALPIVDRLAVPPSLKDARNRSCYEMWQAGMTHKEIYTEMTKHPNWEQFDSPLAVRSAINTWARKNDLEVRKGRAGRPKNTGN